MKTRNKILTGAFAAAIIGLGGLASGRYVMETSLDNGSLAGAMFAKHVLRADQNQYELQHFALTGSLEPVKIMLELGAEKQFRQTAYLWGAGKGGSYPESFFELNMLKYGSKTKQEHAQKVMELVARYAEFPEEKQVMMDNALEQIIRGDDLPMMEYLLKQGANPNANSVASPLPQKRTLGWAAMNRAGKAEEVVDLLLKYGADPQLGLDYLDGVNAAESKVLLQERVREFKLNSSPDSVVPAAPQI